MDQVKFLRPFLKKLLATGFVMLFLGLVALHDGVGYETIEINVKTTEIIPHVYDFWGPGPETGAGGVLYTCNVIISLNPFLYPLSYLLGNGKISHTSGHFDGPILHGGSARYEAMESAKFGAAFPEFFGNLPYIFVIGFLIESLVEKLYSLAYSTSAPKDDSDVEITHMHSLKGKERINVNACHRIVV